MDHFTLVHAVGCKKTPKNKKFSIHKREVNGRISPAETYSNSEILCRLTNVFQHSHLTEINLMIDLCQKWSAKHELKFGQRGGWQSVTKAVAPEQQSNARFSRPASM